MKVTPLHQFMGRRKKGFLTGSWVNCEKKQYEPAFVLDEQVESLSLTGDIAPKDGEPQVHASSTGRKLSTPLS